MKKFVLSSTDFKKSLARLSNVVPNKSSLPVFTNIYCKVTDQSVQLIGSDQETTMILTMPAETTEAPFEFLMPFQLVQKITGLSGAAPMMFTMSANKLKIATDIDTYELKGLGNIEHFPKLPEVPKKNTLQIGLDVLKLMKVATQTVGKDDRKPELMKVLLELRKEGLTVASTDGSFMIFSHTLPEHPSEEDEDLLISPKVIKSIEDIQSAKITWHKKTISIEDENITVLITRPESPFPPYRKMFPQEWPSNLTMDRNVLITALEKCNLSSDYFKIMEIDLTKKGTLIFRVNDKEQGLNINLELPGDYNGPVEKIHVSSEKMLKLMTQVDYDSIQLAIHEKNRPIVFRNEDSGYHGLLTVQFQSV